MSKLRCLSFLVAVAALSSCAPTSDKPSPAASPEPAATLVLSSEPRAAESHAPKVFGAAITESEATSLDAIALEPAKFVNKTIKTEGIVTAVCQHMGCWMEIGDQTKTVHIRMAGHSFFIPKDAAGRHAIVQGQVLESAPSEAACMHEGKDSCAPPADGVTADGVTRLELEATGVELVD